MWFHELQVSSAGLDRLFIILKQHKSILYKQLISSSNSINQRCCQYIVNILKIRVFCWPNLSVLVDRTKWKQKTDRIVEPANYNLAILQFKTRFAIWFGQKKNKNTNIDILCILNSFCFTTWSVFIEQKATRNIITKATSHKQVMHVRIVCDWKMSTQHELVSQKLRFRKMKKKQRLVIRYLVHYFYGVRRTILRNGLNSINSTKISTFWERDLTFFSLGLLWPLEWMNFRIFFFSLLHLFT